MLGRESRRLKFKAIIRSLERRVNKKELDFGLCDFPVSVKEEASAFGRKWMRIAKEYNGDADKMYRENKVEIFDTSKQNL